MLKKIKNCKGNTVVEASIVMPIVLMVIFTMMYLGFILYQKTLLTVVANDAASSIGQVYATTSKDPFIGYTKTSNLSKTKLYRRLTNLINGSVDSDNEQKADYYARYEVKTRSLYKEKGNAVTVDTHIGSGSDGSSGRRGSPPGIFYQKPVTVTIKATYDLPFLIFLGVRNNTVEVVGVGTAQCLDILDYASVMSLTNTILTETVGVLAGGGVSEAARKFSDAIDKFAHVFLKE